MIVSDTRNIEEILKIYLRKQKIYIRITKISDVYRSDLSGSCNDLYVSDCTVQACTYLILPRPPMQI